LSTATEREQYLRWKEHFQLVLNRKQTNELAIIPEAPMDLEIDTDPHSKLEIQKAIKSLKNKKAPVLSVKYRQQELNLS
jgi:hypothetical protein